jgi:hypothetical protein
LRSDHSEKIHIQKSKKKKQGWFLLNPFCNAGGCVYRWKWNPFCNIKDAMYWWNLNPACNIFCQSGAGAHQASLILSFCNGLCFGARYERSMWAQRNSHFTWPVASCGNGRCLMPVKNMSYQ